MCVCVCNCAASPPCTLGDAHYLDKRALLTYYSCHSQKDLGLFFVFFLRLFRFFFNPPEAAETLTSCSCHAQAEETQARGGEKRKGSGK